MSWWRMLKSLASFLKALVLRYEQNYDTLPKTMLPIYLTHPSVFCVCDERYMNGLGSKSM